MSSFSDTALTSSSLVTSGPSWAAEFPIDNESITLDADLCLAVYTDGVVPSGAVLAQVTATERYGPYAGTTDEVQTVTEGGSGLTSFTLTFSGQTTGAIAAGATAAAVQTALEALSNIGAGNVRVTGSAGGPYTVAFIGDLADANVAQMTATPTGGSGTVTVATTTAGGAEVSGDGRGVAAGHLVGAKTVRAGNHVDASLYYKGRVYEDLLPANSGLDDPAKADLSGKIRYSRVGA
jgi:hypothetical protein